jgi:membrane protein implicated in regulation of membrane protease activity
MFGLVTQAKAVKQRMTSLAQLNLELAKLEGKQKATALGVAAGLGLLAAVLVLYAIGFAFAAAAVGLAEALPLWLALLVVAGVLLLLAALSALLARRFARKASPTTPSQAIEEAGRTAEVVKSRV